jgi:2-polyprenyl-3-methyl-5-hydroxy-6-metoxy-1,4-benzoquinol methylase
MGLLGLGSRTGLAIETVAMNQIVKAWDREYQAGSNCQIYEPLWGIVKDYLRSCPSGRLLDFGCGDGGYAFLLSEMGYSVLATDISSEAIQLARQKQKRSDLEGPKFYHCDGIYPAIVSQSLDVVVMLNSYHCLRRLDRERILRDAREKLKSGGLLILSVLSLRDESYPRQEWREFETGSFVDPSKKIFHFFSENEIRTELKDFVVSTFRELQNPHPDTRRESALMVIAASRERD